MGHARMYNPRNGFSERTTRVPHQLHSMTAWSHLPQRISPALLLRAHPDSRSDAFIVPRAHATATQPLLVVT